MSTLLRKTYANVTCDKKEILRYAGWIRRYSQEADFDENALALLDTCIKEAEGIDEFKVCFREFPLRFYEESNELWMDLGFTKTNSKDLYKNLKGCSHIVLFAATIGLPVDRLIEKYNRLSPAKAMFFQAIGTEKIEALCNAFNEDLRREYEEKGFTLHARYSPGYGDCPLEMQKDVIRVLDTARQIGISLNESLLMSPSKSVTAIVGLEQIEK